MAGPSSEWRVSERDEGAPLSAFLRGHTGAPWSKVKRWIATGKVFIDGEREGDAGRRLGAGAEVALRMSAPRREGPPELRIVFEDAHVVVVDKPAGVSTVPYEPKERGTAIDLLRDAWRRKQRARPDHSVMIVHRLDKATSGLVVFAKSKRAERELARQFRAHSTERVYLCVAHGLVEAQRIESRIVADRGDRLRGSARHPGQGKRAVTHVAVRERLEGATLCEVTLETGKTHQIRVHLSELGHPVVGDPVYTRDFVRAGRELIESPRLLLHAHTLGFEHPITGRRLAFESELPAAFRRAVESLSGSSVH